MRTWNTEGSSLSSPKHPAEARFRKIFSPAPFVLARYFGSSSSSSPAPPGRFRVRLVAMTSSLAVEGFLCDIASTTPTARDWLNAGLQRASLWQQREGGAGSQKVWFLYDPMLVLPSDHVGGWCMVRFAKRQIVSFSVKKKHCHGASDASSRACSPDCSGRNVRYCRGSICTCCARCARDSWRAQVINPADDPSAESVCFSVA